MNKPSRREIILDLVRRRGLAPIEGKNSVRIKGPGVDVSAPTLRDLDASDLDPVDGIAFLRPHHGGRRRKAP